MDRVQKVQLRLSESRNKLSELLDTELAKRGESFDEDLKRLSQEIRSLESEYQAALLASPEPETRVEARHESAEDRELRELEESVDFANYVRAALAGHGVVSGPEAELNKHLGLESNYFPMSILARGLEDDLEQRTKRDGDAGASQGRWVDRVFAESAARRLGVTFDSVAPGVAAYPITSAGGSGAQRGREEAVAEGVYTFAVTELKPTRNAVHGVYTIEDAARLPGMADAMVRDMRMAVMDAIDKAVFVGDSGANENSADITGFQTAAGVGESTLTQANKIKGAETLGVFAGMVDGVYATRGEDLRVVASAGAHTLWMSTIGASGNAADTTILEFLRRAGVNPTVRGGIESNTANGDFGAFVGLGRGIRGAAVAAVWEAGQLVRDVYTGAKKGEVELTLNYLWNFGIPRTANFKRLKFVA